MIGAAVLVLPGCGDGDASGRGRLVVSAAASLRAPLSACSREFEGARVRISFAGSDELAAQIRRGVRPGVFLAANTKLPRQLAGEGLVEAPVAFATNELVVAVRRDAPLHTLGDVGGGGVTVVVGDETVPVGAYTRTALARVGGDLERRILANVRSEEPDVSGVVGKLLQGSADAAFVYRSDVTGAGGKLRTIDLPARARPQVVYGGAVVRGAGDHAVARRYLDGVLRGPCARALHDAGFGPAPGR
ncbi:MAG: molybdate ABC transporter substrate-binding protein [Solirubrobacterales bacterium]|nr:molybdate ABC transporter substrate-binding protein [Solirubrobacterales bacterium]